ncbi:MAG TPA: hypothetical protein PLZ33_07810, partial [Smithellaceae bacterium]|nr:hypothetical protein [Smithellaceae bacterium]
RFPDFPPKRIMRGFVKESASFFNHFVMAEVLIRDGFFSFVTAAMDEDQRPTMVCFRCRPKKNHFLARTVV